MNLLGKYIKSSSIRFGFIFIIIIGGISILLINLAFAYSILKSNISGIDISLVIGSDVLLITSLMIGKVIQKKTENKAI